MINDSDTAIYHPYDKSLNRVEIIVIYEPDENETGHWKNCVVFGNGQVDRSPCGSGTCALLALNYLKRRIHLGESLINESIIGTQFIGKALEETKVGKFDAIVPQIEARANITGYHHFIIDHNDPLSQGFSLN